MLSRTASCGKMTGMKPQVRRRVPGRCLLPFALFLLLGAAALDESPDDLIRRANAAFLRGEIETADHLYAAAEERTGDPGLIAFNTAAVLFQKGQFRDAELHYARVLDDKACPPDRAARAWFNRGTCLLRRGSTPAVYRSAIACFDRCLDLNPPDEPLKADARHNLELAKLLWAEANKTAAKPELPNAPPPEEDLNPPPQPGFTDQQPGGPDPGGAGGQPDPQPQPAPGGKPNETNVPTPGNNPNLPQLPDEDRMQPLTPEDTREYLRRTAERLKRDRHGLLNLLYGPERPGVKDW